MQVTQTANFTCHIATNWSGHFTCIVLFHCGGSYSYWCLQSHADSKPAPSAQVAYSYAHHLEVRYTLNEVSEQKWLSSPLTTIDGFIVKTIAISMIVELLTSS